MSFSTKYNKVTHQVDTEGFDYTNLSELREKNKKKPDTTYKVDWLYVRAGKYGTHPIFINTENKVMINIPAHMTTVVESILSDGESVDKIKSGKVGFKIYTYKSHNRECFGVEFVDL